MATFEDKRICNFSKEAESVEADDYFPVDSESKGTRKIKGSLIVPIIYNYDDVTWDELYKAVVSGRVVSIDKMASSGDEQYIYHFAKMIIDSELATIEFTFVNHNDDKVNILKASHSNSESLTWSETTTTNNPPVSIICSHWKGSIYCTSFDDVLSAYQKYGDRISAISKTYVGQERYYFLSYTYVNSMTYISFADGNGNTASIDSTTKAWSYKSTIPTKTSDLTNDSGFIKDAHGTWGDVSIPISPLNGFTIASSVFKYNEVLGILYASIRIYNSSTALVSSWTTMASIDLSQFNIIDRIGGGFCDGLGSDNLGNGNIVTAGFLNLNSVTAKNTTGTSYGCLMQSFFFATKNS